MSKKDLGLNQDSFYLLLNWLDQDRERAAYKYEDIRHKLVAIFTRRGCSDADDLADEVINRVARKVPQISDSYVGDPAMYFYGVARMVYLESSRRRPLENQIPEMPADTGRLQESDVMHECLERCLQYLSPENLRMITLYYQGERKSQIEHRERLADELSIPLNMLRVRVSRIRAALKLCIQECLTEMDK